MQVRKLLFPGQYKIVPLFYICGLLGVSGLFKSLLDVFEQLHCDAQCDDIKVEIP